MVGSRVISMVFVMIVAMAAWTAAVAVLATAAASVPAEATTAGTGSGAYVTMLESAITADFSNGTNNNLGWKPTKSAVDRQQLQPRRFRHEGSAVRVLYQNGVSIFDFRQQ